MLTGCIFLHDAFTYNEKVRDPFCTPIYNVLTAYKHIQGVPVEPLALHPTTGGPKNLPVVKHYLSDIEDEENAELSRKPHLVIVGGGWGVRMSDALARSVS